MILQRDHARRLSRLGPVFDLLKRRVQERARVLQ